MTSVQCTSLAPVNRDRPLQWEEAPVITPEMYAARTRALLELGCGYTHLVIYADKEHFSNLEYLTGYDPRYEECVYILAPGRTPLLALGNEGMGQARCIAVPHEKVLCQSLSPMGQPRGTGQSLAKIFAYAGIEKTSRVGVLGWKEFTPLDGPDYTHMLEVPALLADALRAAADEVENANALMMDCDAGLRAVLPVEELVLSELASAKASRKVWDFISGLRPGLTELEASQHLAIDGEPCPTYPNINFCGKGILSPDPHQKLENGAAVAFGMGYRCAQIHRVGFYVQDREEMERRYPGVYSGLLERYFLSMCAWYESLGLGVSGDTVWKAVRDVVGSYEEFGIVLNPGHLIHTEEWMNSPFYENSQTVLRSGMLIQCDFTARPPAFCGVGVHVEDGVMLANAETRRQIQKIAPTCYARLTERQRFMREELGIALQDEVLPTSDLCGMLHPFLGDARYVLTKHRI